MKRFIKQIYNWLPAGNRDTIFLRSFGLSKVPLISYARPTVLELSEQRTVIRIALNRRTKNHLGSMYFGALAVGADCAAGLIAAKLATEHFNDVSFVFKSAEMQFLKRAEGDVLFTCEQGLLVKEMLQQTLQTGERVTQPIEVIATVPSKLGQEPVAKFTLTISVKKNA